MTTAFEWLDDIKVESPNGAVPHDDHTTRDDESVINRVKLIDWAEAFSLDFSTVDWMPGKMFEAGQQVSLVGDGKVGKSLFSLEWAWQAASGMPFLYDFNHAPVRVLYLDRENSLRDIVTRLQAFGATPDELELFKYASFPSLRPIDSEAGALELVELVDHHRPEVVIVDTVSRFIEGKEDSSDTWLAVYRRFHAHLKARGITGLRLDHFGKDTGRGARGSSAKAQDVDHVWELSATGTDTTKDHSGVTTVTTKLKLKRAHTRTGLGDDEIHVVRTGRKGELWLPGETSHTLDSDVTGIVPANIPVIVGLLERAGAPASAGRGKLREFGMEAGLKPASNQVWAEVARAWKNRTSQT